MDKMQRRSSLMFHLNQAHSKISSLEDYIRERERQFRSMAGSFQRSESRNVGVGGIRLRRVGLSHNLLHMRSTLMEGVEDECEDDVELYSRPLDDYACLTIARISPQADHTPNDVIPFTLHRLVSREYHVGKGGVVIGTGSKCSVRLPTETGLQEQHVAIEWISGSPEDSTPVPADLGHAFFGGHFVSDLTQGNGVFHISRPSNPLVSTPTKEQDDLSTLCELTSSSEVTLTEATPIAALIFGTEDEDGVDPGSVAPLKQDDHMTIARTGLRFVAGRLEFSLTPLPPNLILTLKMFDAAKRGNLDELKVLLEDGKSAEVKLHYISPSPPPEEGEDRDKRLSIVSVVSTQGLDINTEYHAPTYNDEHFFAPGFARRRSSALRGPVSVAGSSISPGPGDVGGRSYGEPRLLLHSAIQQNHEEMVKFLLDQGADPNLCVGELKQDGLHLAAQLNLPGVVRELLHHGGDVEVMDTLHRQPLALTSNYLTRKLLLSTVLLCAAAEVGDYGEVVRLLSSTDVSPNARGLRHKNALHLAAAKGHTHVVQCLLLNKADVNSRGGTRRRTALHYASLHDHVEVAKLLLETGANEFTRDVGGYTPLNLSNGGKMCKLLHKLPLSLCLAVQSGDVEVVKRMLSEMEEEESAVGGAEGIKVVDQRNEQSHAPLHLACTSGNLEVVQLLVSHGASIDLSGGSDSWTPLMYAAMAGHSDVVEFLLAVGADTQEVDNHNSVVSARVEQALYENRDLISQLESTSRTQSLVETAMHTLEPATLIRQESGSSFSLESEKAWLRTRAEKLRATLKVLTSGPDKLLKAIDTRNHSDFRDLLEAGVVAPDVIIDKYSPSTALVRVCEGGLTNFAKILIDYGAQVNQAGTSNQIPLLVAASNGNVDLVKLLCASGADVNAQSEDSMNTALHEAASANSEGCVLQLLAAGARLDLINGAGETAFHCSMIHEIKRLLAVGPNKLLLAAEIGDSDEIKRLVSEEGFGPGHTFHLGWTALHESSESGHVEATKTLIDLGADVNKQIHSSLTTPLHLASRNNHVEVARILISAGAKLDIKDEDGKVPFEVACSNQMRKVLVAARTVRAQPTLVKEGSDAEMNCMICMDRPINTIILPCGHQAFCTTCVSKISHCALDRQSIREVITVFK